MGTAATPKKKATIYLVVLCRQSFGWHCPATGRLGMLRTDLCIGNVHGHEFLQKARLVPGPGKEAVRMCEYQLLGARHHKGALIQ